MPKYFGSTFKLVRHLREHKTSCLSIFQSNADPISLEDVVANKAIEAQIMKDARKQGRQRPVTLATAFRLPGPLCPHHLLTSPTGLSQLNNVL